MIRFLTLLVCLLPAAAVAQDKAVTPEQAEFFEKRVRPVLVQHCYECHSATAKKVKAGLLLDSRAAMLQGGENGPALVPGEPDKSRLIEAIRYTNVDLKMPRKGKLPHAVIADLTTWVKMGAPWPNDKLIKKSTYKDFNLLQRKKDHWCWQPIQARPAPKVQDTAWPTNDIDRFLLAKLEAKGIKPAPPADPRTLLRRLHFDIIGLPPTRSDVDDFVKAWDAAGAKRGKVLEDAVDRLLASPHFGERWGRHWLDLVRYAESRGHEFDFTIPNAYQYRDYVIRAFNADVPYNQFVMEHIAGDVLKNPRMSSQATAFNESILGTAFWFLGEECHSPVDIRLDQADRFDNRIDVMTKTFLGLTVACARCHDHKFDAISTKDYYALFGILESSSYRLARFDTITQHRKIAQEMWRLRNDARRDLQRFIAAEAEPTVNAMHEYLLTAAGIEDHAAKLNPELLKRWKSALAVAAKDETSPLYAFAQVAANRNRPADEVLAPILQRWKIEAAPASKGLEMIADFETRVDESRIDSPGFASLLPGDIVLGSVANRPIARVVEQAGVERDRAWDGLLLSSGTQNESGGLGGAVRAGRTLRTPEFTIKHGRAFALVKGAGMIYAGVGQHIMLAGPLHGGLIQRFNTGDKYQWVAIQLQAYVGQRAHLEFTPNDGADFALVKVVQSAEPPAPYRAFPQAQLRSTLINANSAYRTALLTRNMHLGLVNVMKKDLFFQPPSKAGFAPLANWLMRNLDLFIPPGSEAEKRIAQAATPILDAQRKLVSEIRRDSRLTPAMQDGSGTDEHVFVRGNPKMLGPVVARRFLEAFAGADPLKVNAGSGRLELATQMTDPSITPLITRVYVNRVWHHLFGRGIVGSVDNFGVLGEAPTHPELLDYLAHAFASPLASGEGPEVRGFAWSTKKLIRALVLTKAYQLSSQPDAKADEADPQNLLLHRMRLRRLEGEAIRDAMLRISGRLNAAMGGPSVPVFLTPFQEGRGKPASGPLDGDGRRSVYLSVRRNFLSSFLLAFDTPAPFSTVGRRTSSNVPAQALILMNDPFVHQQADVWAKRVLAAKTSPEDRVRGMYLDAFSRPPTDAELRACVGYLGAAADQRRWADLCHVLFNTKEFYFLN